MPTTQVDHDPAKGCPKCGGALWDNRATKTNPKAPDYKCKDRACDGCIWPPKGNGAAPSRTAAPAPAATTKAPHSAGGPLPWETEAVDTLLTVYTTAYRHAVSLARAEFGPDTSDTTVAAMAATIFIQAAQKGGLVG